MTPAPLYDPSRLQSLDENDPGIVRHMLGLFLELIPGTAEQIREAYQARNIDLVHTLAHRIKPSILELDIRLLKATITDIEREASMGRSTPVLEAHIRYLCKVMDQVKTEIENELSAPPAPPAPRP